MYSNIEIIKTDPSSFKKIFKQKILEVEELIQKNNKDYFFEKDCPINCKGVIRYLYEERDKDYQSQQKKWISLYDISKILASKKANKLIEWEEKLEKVRNIEIQRLIEILNIDTHRRFVECPYHKEKTPSCYVNKNKNFIYSFCCNKSIDVIELYKVSKHCGFKEAINDLHKLFYF